MRNFTEEYLQILYHMSTGLNMEEISTEMCLSRSQLTDRILRMKLISGSITNTHMIRLGFEQGYLIKREY